MTSFALRTDVLPFQGRPRVHVMLLTAFACVWAWAAWRFQLWSILPDLIGLDYARFGGAEHERLSEIAFGCNYIVHCCIGFSAFNNLLVFMWPRYRRSQMGPALVMLCVAPTTYWLLHTSIDGWGVVGNITDDLLLYTTAGVSLANLLLGLFMEKGGSKALSVMASLAAFAFLADTSVCHLSYIETGIGFLRHERDWMADGMTSLGRSPEAFCSTKGFACFSVSATGVPTPLNVDPGPRLTPEVVDNIREAVAKYGIFNPGYPTGKPFEVRHRALTTPTEFMRYAGFKIRTPEGRTIVAVDGLTSAGTILWFQILFGGHLAVCTGIWIVLLAYAAKFHGRASPAAPLRLGGSGISHAAFTALTSLVHGTVAAVLIGIAVMTWDGFSLTGMRASHGHILDAALHAVGTWLCLSVAASAYGVLGAGSSRKAMLAFLVVPLPLAVLIHAALPISVHTALPTALSALLVGGMGVAVVLRGYERNRPRRVIMTLACAFVPLVVLSSEVLLGYGGFRVLAEAAAFASPGSSAQVTADIGRVMSSVPAYLSMAGALSYVPFAFVWSWGSGVLASYHSGLLRSEPLHVE